nr:retrotransposon-derived protein PEG10 [Tanacetum cinerariifolium]
MATLQAELQATKGLIQAGSYGCSGETALPIPCSMRFDVPKFSGTDLDRWIFSSLKKWFRWMTRHNLITTWDGFLESVRHRFGPCKYKDPQGAFSELLQKGTVAQYQPKDVALESGDISTLNSLVGNGSPQTLQSCGTIGLGNIHVLIDNESTHNFVQPGVVERMKLAVCITKPFKVYIGSGETLLCENICSKVGINMQGIAMEVDLYVFMKGMLRRQQQ